MVSNWDVGLSHLSVHFGSFSLSMSIEMPHMIEFISSDTHDLRKKVSRSLLSLLKNSYFNVSFPKQYMHVV